ncbi:MAG: hypothetical protein ACRDGL_04890 [Candidatus Limnocylindrales bacterium]
MTSELPDALPPAPATDGAPGEPAEPRAGAEQPAPAEAVLARRGFFRAFSREAILAIGGVAATAAELQRDSTAVATRLLGLGQTEAEPAPSASQDGPADGPLDLGLGGLAQPLAIMSPLARVSPLAGAPGEADVTPAGVGYRSPYRLDGRTIVIVDQRCLPTAVVEIRCRGGAEIAAAMRELRVRGAPVLAQVAAYGLWLAAASNGEEAGLFMRAAMIRGAADAFRSARPGVAALRQAVDRVLLAWEALGEHAAGDVIADRIRAEADAIAMEALLGQARLGRTGSAVLPARGQGGGPLRILTIDETGALGGGTVGTAMGVITTAVAEGRAVEVLLAETRPSLDGARLGAWELGLAGIPTRVIADGAAPGLLAAGAVDVVLVGADAVARDGALLNAAGTYPLALAAARAGLPFLVCTTIDAVDLDAAVAADLRPEQRRLVAGSLAEPDPLPPGAPEPELVEQPLQDITPPDLLSAYVTDAGLLQAPFAAAFAGVVRAPAGAG